MISAKAARRRLDEAQVRVLKAEEAIACLSDFWRYPFPGNMDNAFNDYDLKVSDIAEQIRNARKLLDSLFDEHYRHYYDAEGNPLPTPNNESHP
jgi:hypothetical protein